MAKARKRPWKLGADGARWILDANGTVLCELPRGGVIHGKIDTATSLHIIRAVNSFDALLAACKRFVKNGVCTCADGGPGFQCDLCEGALAIEKATGQQ